MWKRLHTFFIIKTSVWGLRKTNALMNPTRNDYVAPAVEVLEISGAESCCIAVSGENNQGSGEDMPWG